MGVNTDTQTDLVALLCSAKTREQHIDQESLPWFHDVFQTMLALVYVFFFFVCFRVCFSFMSLLLLSSHGDMNHYLMIICCLNYKVYEGKNYHRVPGA